MKTIIVYATKHGAAEEVARRIADRIGGAAIYNLKSSDIPSLNDFDCVIIGSSIYAGMIRKEAKVFLSKNTAVLKEKSVGLFLCGLDASQEKTYFDSNFAPEILQAAKATGFMGGIFDPQKAGFMERFIMKMVAKQSVYSNTIDDDKIVRFVGAMGV